MGEVCAKRSLTLYYTVKWGQDEPRVMAICACVGTIGLAGLDVCWRTERSLPQEQKNMAAYRLVHIIPIVKHVRSTMNTRQYDPEFGQTTDGGWICKEQVEWLVYRERFRMTTHG
jgi:hypothetical protein